MTMVTTLRASVPEFPSPSLKTTRGYFNSHGDFGVSVSQFGRRRFLTPSRVFAVSDINKLVTEFDPKIPLERASTPPSSWYTDPQFYSFELDRVFYGGWQAVGQDNSHSLSVKNCFSKVVNFAITSFLGYSDQIKESRDFFTGRLVITYIYICKLFCVLFNVYENFVRRIKHWCRLGDVEYVVCRDDNGKIHAFHNVCSHHASILVSGNGKKSCFVCPYHVSSTTDLKP